MLETKVLQLKSMDFSMNFQETAKLYKRDKDCNDISFFSSAHTVDPNKSDDDYNGFLAFLSTYRFALAAKLTRITMIFQCFFYPRIPLVET